MSQSFIAESFGAGTRFAYGNSDGTATALMSATSNTNSNANTVSYESVCFVIITVW